MCLAQGPQRSDAGEARIRGLSVSSQALYHWATVLPVLILTTGIAPRRMLQNSTSWSLSELHGHVSVNPIYKMFVSSDIK